MAVPTRRSFVIGSLAAGLAAPLGRHGTARAETRGSASPDGGAALPGPTLLLLGDSHTYGAFGGQLHTRLAETGRYAVVSAAAGGATWLTWLEERPVAGAGYRLRTSARGERAPHDVEHVFRGPMPNVDTLLATYDPAIVVVALGTNHARGNHREGIDRFLARVQGQAARRVFWIGPPAFGPGYGHGATNGLRAALASHPDVELFESVSFNEGAPLPLDNPHFGPADARRWATPPGRSSAPASRRPPDSAPRRVEEDPEVEHVVVRPARGLLAAAKHVAYIASRARVEHAPEADFEAVLLDAPVPRPREVEEQLVPDEGDPLGAHRRVVHAELVAVARARAGVAEAHLAAVPVVEREVAGREEEVRLELEPRLLREGAGGRLPVRVDRPVERDEGERSDEDQRPRAKKRLVEAVVPAVEARVRRDAPVDPRKVGPVVANHRHAVLGPEPDLRDPLGILG